MSATPREERDREAPPSSTVARPAAWRTPVVILLCGCLIALIGFGARSGLGFFLTPMSQANGWGRDVFSLALAIQMLLWGAAQPFAGGIADRYGPVLGAERGRGPLCARSRRHGLREHARHAPSHGRRGDRLRPCRLVLHGGDRRLRQADAAGVADVRVRRRHGRRFVRPVPVLAACGRVDRRVRLAAHAADFRRLRSAHHPAVAGIGGSRRGDAGRRRAAQAIGHAGALRGLRPSQLRAAGARLLHLRLPDILHRRASAGVSGRSRTAGRGRRLGARHDWIVQHLRRDRRRPAEQPHAQALRACAHLFRPLGGDPGLHPAAGHHGFDAPGRRRPRPAVAVDRTADLGTGGGHVRHALACDAVRLCVLQPSGRRFSRGLAGRRVVRAHRLV